MSHRIVFKVVEDYLSNMMRDLRIASVATYGKRSMRKPICFPHWMVPTWHHHPLRQRGQPLKVATLLR